MDSATRGSDALGLRAPSLADSPKPIVLALFLVTFTDRRNVAEAVQ
jgi:hypothetical protein